MDKKAMEARLHELKGKQAAVFTVKKAQRNTVELEAIRKEMNELKSQAAALYRAKK
jgi:hypothetical protein